MLLNDAQEDTRGRPGMTDCTVSHGGHGTGVPLEQRDHPPLFSI